MAVSFVKQPAASRQTKRYWYKTGALVVTRALVTGNPATLHQSRLQLGWGRQESGPVHTSPLHPVWWSSTDASYPAKTPPNVFIYYLFTVLFNPLSQLWLWFLDWALKLSIWHKIPHSVDLHCLDMRWSLLSVGRRKVTVSPISIITLGCGPRYG